MSRPTHHPEAAAGALENGLPHAETPRGGPVREPSGPGSSPASAWTAEQRYRWFMATADEGIWRFEFDPPVPLDLPEVELAETALDRGRLAECNGAYARHHGFEWPHEMVGCRLVDLMPGSPDEQLAAVLAFVRSGYRLSDVETVEQDRTGRVYCVREHVAGILVNGCLAGGWGMQRDITEQKRAEEELRANESRFRSVIENISDVLTLVDAEGVIRFESPSVERAFGYPRHELEGRNAFDLLHPDDLARISGDFARLLQAPGTTSPVTELRLRHKDGTWRTAEVVGKCLAAPGGPPSVVMSFRDITLRKNTEQALRASEERFRGLFEASPIGIEIYDADGRLELANRACLEMFGIVDPQEARGFRLFEDPDLPEGIAERVRAGETVSYEAPFDFDTMRSPGRHRTHRSGRVHLRIVITPLHAAEAAPGGFLVQVEDVTERRRTEQSLRLAQHAVDIAGDAVFWLRPDASICYANAAAARLLGYTVEEVLGLTAFDINTERTPENWAADWDRLRRQQSYALETVFRTKSGTLVPVEITAGYLEFGSEIYNFSFVRDITERKRAAEHLATLATALEQAADDIVVTDAAGVITYVNSAFERTTGYSRTEAVGRSPRFLDNGGHGQDFYRAIDATIASGRTWQGRFNNRTRDGRAILQDASISPILDGTGRVVGQVSARRDVTRQVELEGHAAQADKLEAIGTMAGGIAHDFNNILSAILGYTQMAMRKCPEDSPIHRDLQAVLLGSRRAAELVKQILTFSRHQQTEEQAVQVSLIVKEAAKFLRASIPATVEIRTDLRSEAAVLAEPTDLHRIVINLCTNAALAMQDRGGLLELALADADLDESFASKHAGVAPGRFVRLTVRDTGHGMTREVQARIFEPFFTTRECGTGTGMGLAVVHGIVARCHGAITVESEPGRGTTFEVHLPRIEREALAEPAPAEPLTAGSGRVLVVDDEPQVAAMAVDQLNAMGYRATACANGSQALEAFTADPRAIDLVITDMTMPGMTGDVLARRLKSLRPDLPVILCTGYSERITPETARQQGIDEFAMKPIAMAELSRLVHRALERR